MSESFPGYFETREYAHSFSPEAARGGWLTVFYLFSGGCRVMAPGFAPVKLYPRHLLLIDSRRLGDVNVTGDEPFRCCVLHISQLYERSPLQRSQVERSDSLRLFLKRRPAICQLIDSDVENIHITIRDLQAESASVYPLQEETVETLLSLLLLKLARSWHSHNRATYIHYIANAKKFIFDHVDEHLTVQMIADHLHIHRSYLQMLFSRHVGHTLTDYINHVRIGKAMLLLSSTDERIIDIAMATGFNSRQHFARIFQRYAGCSPKDYRKLQSTEKSRECLPHSPARISPDD